ncbi:hypothetical protein [Teredinibacter sp. KSP-S5-2]|uniref:DUF7716 domain-containing protein n=1 Tax=Teredinibacter sp. KSP-S5-2 TaxID=3034506 RepID=UPI0029347799|nr:hypothetical protein [Teredinibacter sp. KSP-S5-2]WNO10610.1 hypothetical protein P5V12_05425 [Teredinibacter sp. KSP-S5-2]
MSFEIGKGISLKEHIQRCIRGDTHSEWMIFSGIDLTLDMLVFPVYLDVCDLYSDEYGEIEDQVLSQGDGYGNLLNENQLLDIVNNLLSQRHNYTDKELEAALNYYSRYDTFIEL